MSTINRLFCVFDEPVTEAGFRSWSLPQDLLRARVAITATIPLALLFVWSDYMMFGTASPFPTLVGARIAYVLYSIAALILLTRLRASRSVDALILLWSTISAGALAYVAYTRPPMYSGHLVMEVVAVFFLVAVMPNQLRFQMVSAVVMAAGTIFVAVSHGLTQDPLMANVVWGAFAASVAFGSFVSWDSHVSRRRLYSAMTEVGTLRGMIPMCARCRKVRDDDGSWGQLEVYLSKRTEAEFTHGYCPECYGEVTRDLE